MTVHDYLGAIRKQWLVAVILTLLGAGAAFGIAQTMPDMYRSTSSAYASASRGESTSELVQGSTYVQNLVQSYAVLAKSPFVLQPVIDELDLDLTVQQLSRSMTADTPLNTVVIDISAVSSDPMRARDITSSITQSLADAVADISPKDATGAPSVTLTIITPANTPVQPFSPDTKMITAIGGAVGLLLGLAWAVVREIFDTRVRTAKDVETVTEVPVLTEIGRTPRDGGIARVLRATPNGGTAEAFRSLVMSLAFADVDKPVTSIVVTSAMPGDGKSSVSIGLAMSLAERGGRVLLVDADLRKPSIDAYTGLDGAVGLTSVLLGGTSVERAVQPWAVPGLDVLVAGIVPPNPNQLLASDAMRDLIGQVKDDYDFVVIDTSPLIPVTDPLWIVRETDGAIVVARARKTKRDQLTKALATLDSVGARILGIAANDVKLSERPTYYTQAEETKRSSGRAAATGSAVVPAEHPSAEPTSIDTGDAQSAAVPSRT